MDGQRFDALARGLATGQTTRRTTLRLLAGGGLGIAIVPGPEPEGTAAQGAENHAGCRHNRRPCRRARQCCSGRCKRGTCKPSRGQGTCQGEDSCQQGLTTCNGDPACHCFVTLGGRSFCGAFECAECTSNRECAERFQPGSVCAPCGGTICPGTGTACVRPCATT